MPDQSNKQFDDKLRKALRGFEASYQEEDWLLMEDKLDEDNKLAWYWWANPKFRMLAAAMLLFLLGGLYLYNVDSSTSELTSESINTHTKESEGIQNSQPLEQKVAAVDNELTESYKSENNTPEDSNTNHITNKNLTIEQKDLHNQSSVENQLANNKQASSAENPLLNNNTSNKELTNNTTINNIATQQVASRTTSANPSRTVKDPTPKQESNVGNIALKPSETNAAGSLNPNFSKHQAVEPINPLSVSEMAALELSKSIGHNSQESEPISLPNTAHLPKFTLGIATGLQNHFLDDFQFAPFSYNFGVSFGYRIAPKWSIESGIYYNRDNFYSRNMGVFNLNTYQSVNLANEDFVMTGAGITDSSSSDHIYSFKAEFQSIEVPIVLNYYFANKSNFTPFAGLGTSVLVPVSQQFEYEYNSERPRVINLRDYNNRSLTEIAEDEYSLTERKYTRTVSKGLESPYAGFVILNAGFHYQLNDKLALSLNANARMSVLKHNFDRGFNKYNENIKSRISTSGLQLGVKYSL